MNLITGLSVLQESIITLQYQAKQPWGITKTGHSQSETSVRPLKHQLCLVGVQEAISRDVSALACCLSLDCQDDCCWPLPLPPEAPQMTQPTQPPTGTHKGGLEGVGNIGQMPKATESHLASHLWAYHSRIAISGTHSLKMAWVDGEAL